MWIVFALLAALLSAVVVTLSKIGVKNVDSSLAFAIQSILILLVAWSVVAVQGNLGAVASIPRRDLLFLVAAGVVTCLSSLLSFRALKLGDASAVSSLERVSLVFAIVLAVVFLREKLNWQLVLGALLMVGGAVLIAASRQSAG